VSPTCCVGGWLHTGPPPPDAQRGAQCHRVVQSQQTTEAELPHQGAGQGDWQALPTPSKGQRRPALCPAAHQGKLRASQPIKASCAEGPSCTWAPALLRPQASFPLGSPSRQAAHPAALQSSCAEFCKAAHQGKLRSNDFISLGSAKSIPSQLRVKRRARGKRGPFPQVSNAPLLSRESRGGHEGEAP
jgi:hypothetical protein